MVLVQRANCSEGSEGTTEFFCSSGTARAVSDYMLTHLPKAGWQKVTVNGKQLWTIQTPGAPRLYMRLNPITDPRQWSELEYYDSFTP